MSNEYTKEYANPIQYDLTAIIYFNNIMNKSGTRTTLCCICWPPLLSKWILVSNSKLLLSIAIRIFLSFPFDQSVRYSKISLIQRTKNQSQKQNETQKKNFILSDILKAFLILFLFLNLIYIMSRASVGSTHKFAFNSTLWVH